MTYSAMLMMVLSLHPGPLTSRVFVGFATDMKQGKHLYAEEHEASYDNGRPARLTTTYRDELRNIIATRIMDFSQHAFTPNFRLENLRTGYVEGAERVNGALRLYVRRATNEPIIVLTYDIQTTRLLSYEGISNISDDKGENYFVKIAFSPLGP